MDDSHSSRQGIFYNDHFDYASPITKPCYQNLKRMVSKLSCMVGSANCPRFVVTIIRRNLCHMNQCSIIIHKCDKIFFQGRISLVSVSDEWNCFNAFCFESLSFDTDSSERMVITNLANVSRDKYVLALTLFPG